MKDNSLRLSKLILQLGQNIRVIFAHLLPLYFNGRRCANNTVIFGSSCKINFDNPRELSFTGDLVDVVNIETTSYLQQSYAFCYHSSQYCKTFVLITIKSNGTNPVALTGGPNFTLDISLGLWVVENSTNDGGFLKECHLPHPPLSIS